MRRPRYPTLVRQVFVATTGSYAVLVSDQSGPIKVGDFITISAVDGVGMKATGEQEIVLGKAAQGFNPADATSHLTLNNSLGGKQDIGIGRITVKLGIAR